MSSPILVGLRGRFGLALGAIVLLFALASDASAAIRFVAQDATGAGNGASWADAFLHPQDAVNVSGRGDQVWVKEGRYLRKHLAPQLLALRNGVSVYGGFAGGEDALAQRDPALHETILDGEHVVAHVVVTPGGGRLDGFTVTGGGLPAVDISVGGGFSGDGATLAHLVFRDNRAYHGGGAFGDDLVVEDSRFEANYAAGEGGALRVEGSTWVRRSAFVGNEAEEDDTDAAHRTGFGGALYAGFGTTEVEDSSFESNVAFLGGAILIDGFAGSTVLRVRRCGFTGNRNGAISEGYGVLETTIEDSSFAANAALTRTDSYCMPSPPGGCEIWETPAKGAALAVHAGTATVRRCTFSANTSERYGGALYSEMASTVIEDSRFEDNEAEWGGAILLDRALHFVSDSVFQRNRATTGSGGAVSLYATDAPPSTPTGGTFERCRFEENVASVSGGALALFDGQSVVESSRFFGNQALLGGGIVASSVTPGLEARFEMRNSVLAYNQASSRGGALGLNRITAQIENDTFYGNTASSSGGGVWTDVRADVTIRNTILWNDTAVVLPEIEVGSMVFLSVDYSDVQGGWPGVGNLAVDPGLRDPFLLDFHLTWPGSKLLVDTGTPGFSPVFDFDGELRPIDGNLDGEARVDIGADELADPCAGQLDRDLDGACDVVDNCPFAPNPGQQDTGGIGVGSPPDGIGDACQCGDVSGDGFVTITDAVIVTRSLLMPPTVVRTRPELCDVGASAGCSIADAVIIRRALLMPPSAVVQQTCDPGQP